MKTKNLKIFRYNNITLLFLLTVCIMQQLLLKDFNDMNRELKQVQAEFIVDEDVSEGGLEIKWTELLEKTK